MGKVIRAVLITALLLTITAPLFSQTADKLEALMNEPELNWSDAAAFIFEAADLDPEGSFRFAAEQKWLPKNVSSGDAARLNGIALLLMQSFDIKGGIFYRISKSPHHAYRELVYKNIIRGNTDPDMLVSGQQLLLLVNRILAMKEQS